MSISKIDKVCSESLCNLPIAICKDMCYNIVTVKPINQRKEVDFMNKITVEVFEDNKWVAYEIDCDSTPDCDAEIFTLLTYGEYPFRFPENTTDELLNDFQYYLHKCAQSLDDCDYYQFGINDDFETVTVYCFNEFYCNTLEFYCRQARSMVNFFENYIKEIQNAN